MSFPSGSMFKVVTYDTRAYKFSINASINSSGETSTRGTPAETFDLLLTLPQKRALCSNYRCNLTMLTVSS